MLKDYLIAIDLDETLVYDFDKMDIESFDKLKEISKDNKIIIATGRPMRSSINFYNYLGLDTILINYNGAWVHNPKDKTFEAKHLYMDRNLIFKLLRDCKDLIKNVFSEIEDDLYLLEYNEEVRPFLHEDGARIHVGELEKILPHDPIGAVLFVKEGAQHKIEEYVEKEFKGKAHVRFWRYSNPVVAEFYTPMINKGVILEDIRKYYGIAKEKTIAFGDGQNDIGMLQFATYGVAMANSHPILLEQAKYKTSSLWDHGVKEFLEKLEKGIIK